MKLGVFTPVFGGLEVREMLARVRALEHVQAIELGTEAGRGPTTSMSTRCSRAATVFASTAR